VVEEHKNFGFFVYHEPRLVRIQVKTGRLIKGGGQFDFNTVSVTPGKGPNKTKGYVGKAEFFAVYLPDNGKVYMIAINDLPSGGHKMSTMTLRFKEYGLLLGGRYGTKLIPYEEAVQMKYSLRLICWASQGHFCQVHAGKYLTDAKTSPASCSSYIWRDLLSLFIGEAIPNLQCYQKDGNT
jgi:hypothetical protein